MNFRISTNDATNLLPTGNVIYSDRKINIESDFPKTIIHKNLSGTVVCLGSVYSTDQLKPVDAHFDLIEQPSFQNIISELEGSFVLIFVCDKGVSVGTDKFGKVEVYYYEDDVSFTLASNLDLLPKNFVEGGFNQAALAHTLTYYGYRPPKKETLYNSVNRLGVDEFIKISHGQKIILGKRDFDIECIEEYTDGHHDEYTKMFLGHLKDAASEDGNLIYLSSGWDSTSILAGLVHLVGKDKVSGVIGKMKYSERSGCCNQIEIDKAHRFAKYYDIKLDVVDFDLTVEDKSYYESLRVKMRKHQLYALTAITHDKLAIKAAQVATKNQSIFAGEISDGAHNLGFSQYATIFHPSHGFREYSDKMNSYLFGPTFLSLLINGEYINDPIYQLFKNRAGDMSFDEIGKSEEEVKLQLLTSLFLRDARLPLSSIDNEVILTSKGGDYYTQEMQKNYLVEIANNMSVDNVYASYLYLYNSFHWQGSTVFSLQTMAGYHGLETDLPFWNKNLQKFLSKMPEDWGRSLDLNPTKYPLKKMLKDGGVDYPYDYQKGAHSYTYDVDHSFNHAQEVFCYSALVNDFQESIKDKPYHQILSKAYFNLDYIDNLVDQYISAPEDLTTHHITKLVPIIMLCYVGWYGKK